MCQCYKAYLARNSGFSSPFRLDCGKKWEYDVSLFEKGRRLSLALTSYNGSTENYQFRKTPKRTKKENSQAAKKNKNHKGKLPSQKGKFPSIKIIKI